MGFPIFCFPNLSDRPNGALTGATLTGPAWAMALSNMQDPRLSRFARSRSAEPKDTWFDVSFNGFEQLRAFVLIRHNFSVTARLRLTAWYPEGSYFDFDYQSEFDAHPTIAATEDLPYEAENWWDCKPLTRSIERKSLNVPHVLPAPSSAPHWRVEIFDEANPKGYVQIGRLWMATGWQVSQAMERSPTLRLETDTGIEVSQSGAEFADVRPVFRVWNLGFKFLPKAEALNEGLEMMRQAGTHRELFFLHDPDDTTNLQAMSFLARFRTLQPWEQATFAKVNLGFELKELL